MDSKELVIRIRDRLTYMSVDDLTTAESQIVNLLILAGYMKYDNNNETVPIKEN